MKAYAPRYATLGPFHAHRMVCPDAHHTHTLDDAISSTDSEHDVAAVGVEVRHSHLLDRAANKLGECLSQVLAWLNT